MKIVNIDEFFYSSKIMYIHATISYTIPNVFKQSIISFTLK